MFHLAIRNTATPPLDGMLVHCNLTLPSAFHQSSLTVYWYPFILLGEDWYPFILLGEDWYPFILLGEERHCEN